MPGIAVIIAGRLSGIGAGLAIMPDHRHDPAALEAPVTLVVDFVAGNKSLPKGSPGLISHDGHFGDHRESMVLIASVFIAGLCSIIYELLISTASSYFLGDSIKQFSLTIGFYMAAMGVGSYLSRLIDTKLLQRFIGLEIALGVVGGLSVPILYFLYAFTDAYSVGMVLMILVIGVLIGLEIPLLTRIMSKYYSLKLNISNVLSVDYFGALVATLLFPFFLLPLLGTFRSSLFFGGVNMSICFLNLWCFKEELSGRARRKLTVLAGLGSTVLVVLFVLSPGVINYWSSHLYEDQVLLSRQTPYQKVVLTKNKDDIRLFIDGNLQFSSIDEYRYHESLVHVPLSLAPKREHILVLGGGDGLVAREVLKYDDVIDIHIVDLDSELTTIVRQNRFVRDLNKGSLDDPRVRLVHQDAFTFLKKDGSFYDVIIADLPDPNNVSLARLYSVEFFRAVRARMGRTGVFVTQSTSPFFAKNSFWTIHNSIQASGFQSLYPYHVYVPSFGDWGFVMAAGFSLDMTDMMLSVPTRFLNDEGISGLFFFEKDLENTIDDVSTLDNPVLLQHYLKDWKYWN